MRAKTKNKKANDDRFPYMCETPQGFAIVE